MVQLPTTLAATYEHFLLIVERSDARILPVPSQIAIQARLAVVSNLSLDALLRRCVAVTFLLKEYLQHEIEMVGISGEVSSGMTKRLEASFDQVFDAIVTEYKSTALLVEESPNGRRLDFVQEVFGGASDDLTSLGYDVSLFHIGVVAKGDKARDILTTLARQFGARQLTVALPDSTLWGWLGAGEQWSSGILRAALASTVPRDASFALGSSSKGIAGWRSTHQEAKAAFSLSLLRSEALFYEDVALESSALQDPVLSEFLRRRYLDPLTEGRSDGVALIETVRTYLSTGRNGVSASAALGVSRQTVTNRLRLVEERVGKSLDSCAMDLDLALRIAEVNGP